MSYELTSQEYSSHLLHRTFAFMSCILSMWLMFIISRQMQDIILNDLGGSDPSNPKALRAKLSYLRGRRNSTFGQELPFMSDYFSPARLTAYPMDRHSHLHRLLTVGLLMIELPLGTLTWNEGSELLLLFLWMTWGGGGSTIMAMVLQYLTQSSEISLCCLNHHVLSH